MSQVDWSKAPQSSTHFSVDDYGEVEWWAVTEGKVFFFDDRELVLSKHSHLQLKLEEIPFKFWTGEGLPPVGIDAEVLFDSQPKKYVGCKILAHDEGRAVYRFTTGSRKGEYGSDLIHFTSGNKIPMFRPIRTPEQIAAEVREKDCKEMLAIIKASPWGMTAGPHEVIALLYDAGYRKFEITED